MTLDAIYVTYWSLRDPLCQSQALPVVRDLAGRGYGVGLVTFEQAPWSMPAEERRQLAADLAAAGVRWFPRRYHKRPPLLSTVWDVVLGAWMVRRLAARTGARLVHARATVACMIGYLATRLTRARFFADADSPLSQEYTDAGVWRPGSLPQRLTAWMERRALAAADRVAVLTTVRQQEVRGPAGSEVSVLPCGVDTSLFAPAHGLREARREELGLRGAVLVYAGKWGGWYATEEMLDFVQLCGSQWGEVSLLILTTEDPARFQRAASARGLTCQVRGARREEMPGYLAAADAGLSFVRPLPSKRASSPVKNGEYLACGLPIVTTSGIGDYTELVRHRRVGVVVGALSPDAYGRAAAELRALWRDPGLAERCRAAAVEEVGLREVVLPRYRAIHEELLGAPGGAA